MRLLDITIEFDILIQFLNFLFSNNCRFISCLSSLLILYFGFYFYFILILFELKNILRTSLQFKKMSHYYCSRWFCRNKEDLILLTFLNNSIIFITEHILIRFFPVKTLRNIWISKMSFIRLAIIFCVRPLVL